MSLFPAPNAQRSAILIHQANTMDELLGCVGVGDSLGMVKGRWAVLNSVVTLRAFLAEVPNADIPVNIYTGFHG